MKYVNESIKFESQSDGHFLSLYGTKVEADFTTEVGDDVLRLDWTCSAAVRCGGKHLLNALDGRGFVLTSKLTSNAKPWSANASIQELLCRGVRPSVAYVDDECCNSWLPVLQHAWPGIHVRLDVLHAMKRLTQTTTSTRHPCHGRFCAMLSKAFFESDEKVLQRLVVAWRREHGSIPLPRDIERKYVPRSIRAPTAIANDIDAVLQSFQHMSDSSGPLLTKATHDAWFKLKQHVLKGCLSDPTDVNVTGSDHVVTIGGESFHTIQSLRGTSPVEGLHAHQKQWLGTFAQHAVDVGEALLKDGAERWNRAKRERRPFQNSETAIGNALET